MTPRGVGFEAVVWVVELRSFFFVLWDGYIKANPQVSYLCNGTVQPSREESFSGLDDDFAV
ncbi:MAG TPA: hypothetical protein VHW70_14755 [Edaphobacter sp.]|jgi:hypothetical protein|nr:hypothetical protein [Edaphobacter sp.]